MALATSKLSFLAGTLIAAGLFCCGGAFEQTGDRDPAFERAKHLQRGVNASLWFAQSSDYSKERLRTVMTEDDIALIEKLGFDPVRLSVDAAPLLKAGLSRRDSTSPFLTELDRVVTAMLRHHLSMIVDVHPESSYEANLRSGDEPVERSSRCFGATSRHISQPMIRNMSSSKS